MQVSVIQRCFKHEDETLLAQKGCLVPICKKKKKKNGDNNLDKSLARRDLFWKISFPRESEKWNLEGNISTLSSLSGSVLTCKT